MGHDALLKIQAPRYQSVPILKYSGSIHEETGSSCFSFFSPLSCCDQSCSTTRHQDTQACHKRCYRKQAPCNQSPSASLKKTLLTTLSYPSLPAATLFLLTSTAQLVVYFIPVPGGSLRVKCQRPGCTQTLNESEMIQANCQKQESGTHRQAWLLRHRVGSD